MTSLFQITPPPQTLKDIHEKWKGCKECFFTKKMDYTPCLPNGPKGSDVLIIGQWPGQEDMKTGEPFSGPQGKVCKDFLFSAGFSTNELFYTNVLMCSCPMTPTKDVLENCEQSLEEVISVIKPKLIITLGSIAAKRLNLKEVLGRVPEYRGIKVVTCVHPAAIARAKSKEDKKKVTEDVIMALGMARRVYGDYEY